MSRRAPCPASLRIIRHSRTLRRVSITMNRCLGSATSLASLSWGDRGFTRAAKRTRGPNTQAKNQNKHSLKQAYSGPRSGDHEHTYLRVQPSPTLHSRQPSSHFAGVPENNYLKNN